MKGEGRKKKRKNEAGRESSKEDDDILRTSVVDVSLKRETKVSLHPKMRGTSPHDVV